MDNLLRYFIQNYLPKEEIMYRLPVSIPIADFWPEELAHRKSMATPLPLASWDGHPYRYVSTDKLLGAGDRFVKIALDENTTAMPQYEYDDGVIDEAFYSSVIEGAYSTRQRAREVITSGASPKNRSEQMMVSILIQT